MIYKIHLKLEGIFYNLQARLLYTVVHVCFYRGQGNRSLQTSQLLEETAGHKVETYGLPLPVLITEALTLTDSMYL